MTSSLQVKTENMLTLLNTSASPSQTCQSPSQSACLLTGREFWWCFLLVWFGLVFLCVTALAFLELTLVD